MTQPQPHHPPLNDLLSKYMVIAATYREDQLTLEDVMSVNNGYLISFRGQLRMESDKAYTQLDEELAPYDLMALFRRGNKGEFIVHIANNRPEKPAPARVWLPIILMILTFLSTMTVGTQIAIGEIGLTNTTLAQSIADDFLANLWRGLPYAMSIALILGGHELGHYWVLRRYGAIPSLPYFIPLPFISLFGTLGAVINLREPIKNRRMLLDMGASGPLVGFVFAVPILLYGLATSAVTEISPGGIVEGNSVLYILSKLITFGRMLPDGQVDVMLNQFAWAGWVGLFVTGLNMIPLGQLDGGHILYSIWGKQARTIYRPMLGAIAIMALFGSSAWVFLGLMIAFAGTFYAVPLDDYTPLDNQRRWIAMIALTIFVLILVPIPLSTPGENSGLLGMFLISVGLSYLTLWSRRR
jgi:Zn-dependent protease